ncbi:hypothetical protein AB3Y40_04060 [Yoonia sp. R2331]|uniref:hypothetical protein n=1 Tax=Yoonia sp. R2331 TaxID=3237238 RepID=UPI0034E41DB4
MLFVAIVPSGVIYAPGIATAFHWPIIAVAAAYGGVTALAGHRLETWRMAMWGEFWGPQMMGLFLAVAAGFAGWMHLHLTLPLVFLLVPSDRFEMQVEIEAIRGGGKAEAGIEQVVLDFAGQPHLPYEAVFAGMGRFDRVAMPDAMGLTVLAPGSVYTSPVPALISGRGNGIVLHVESVTLLP